jgi:NNP family nitrate/nitrite transporter-like MFS transporter
MNFKNKATKLNLGDFSSPQMRTFWITSLAFFMCFFAWFGIVPFMPQVVKDLGLTPDQKYNSIIAAVAGTVIARLALGKLCDMYGPRICYTFLLIFGAMPVIGIAFVETYTQFLICRILIGFIGASFVITQYHTSLMFASNCVGTANATSAGWGNLGGGANRLGMPIIASVVIACGVSEEMSWRYSMAIAGGVCLLVAILYYFFTQDTPEGNFKDLKARGEFPEVKKSEGSFRNACMNRSCWILFLVYAGCFGVELTVYGTMDDYLQKQFNIERSTAGYLVASFALMNIFARTLGGLVGDTFGSRFGMKGRVYCLVGIMMLEGCMLMTFSQVTAFSLGLVMLILFSLTVQMAEGATFTVVPFVNRKAIGSVAGIVGAGGNVGAVLAGVLMKSNVGAELAKVSVEGSVVGNAKAVAEASAMSDSFFIIGALVIVAGLLAATIRLEPVEDEVTERDASKNIAPSV